MDEKNIGDDNNSVSRQPEKLEKEQKETGEEKTAEPIEAISLPSGRKISIVVTCTAK